MSTEFDLIERYFKPLSSGLNKGDIGIGDDGAVLSVPENHQLVVVTDTLVSGVHFPVETDPYDIAWKALAVNLSDLAAMGAKPGFFSLALTLPSQDDAWLEAFAKGLSDLAYHCYVRLVGGDTTKGPLTITVTAHGWVPKGQAVCRSGANLGDVICVTNTIGDGALGLKFALKTLPETLQSSFEASEQEAALQALNRPMPQLSMIELLRKYATSAIDISDGLVADLEHVIHSSNLLRRASQASTLSAKIDLEYIPLSNALKRYIELSSDWSAVLAGGDDYQLCFTISPQHFEVLKKAADVLDVQVTEIGYCVEKIETLSGVEKNESAVINGSVVLCRKGVPLDLSDFLQSRGYLHF